MATRPTLLVQAALAAGATVAGLAGGPAKVERVAAIGPGVVAVDYDLPSWQQAVRDAVAPREVTVAFDGVGGERGGGRARTARAGRAPARVRLGVRRADQAVPR